MQTIEEKRVFGDRGDTVDAFVASDSGVVRVRIAGDTVGEFGLCFPESAHDVEATFDGIAVATDEDVRLLTPSADEDARFTDVTVTDTGFGAAVAVGTTDETVLAADPDGTLARYDGEQWRPLGSVESDVRAIDGDLVATADGVVRVGEAGVTAGGLEDVADVTAGPVPLAATSDGLYQLGNGWMRVTDRSFEVVASESVSGRLECAHAAGDTLWAYESADGEWTRRVDPPGAIAALAYGERTYAVTACGVFLVETEDGQWRSHHLGTPTVTGMTVATE